MSAVGSLIAARGPGEAGLRVLAVALVGAVAAVGDTPEPPTEVVAALEWGETQGGRPSGWGEVRAARDFGDLSPAEYEYLMAAVEALTMEDT